MHSQESYASSFTKTLIPPTPKPENTEHETEHGIEHSTEHGIEYGTEHGTEYGTKHQTEHGTEHTEWQVIKMPTVKPNKPSDFTGKD